MAKRQIRSPWEAEINLFMAGLLLGIFLGVISVAVLRVIVDSRAETDLYEEQRLRWEDPCEDLPPIYGSDC